MPLAEYRRKRDFSRTREPEGRSSRSSGRRGRSRAFVVQKHAASRLHYDFRLEFGGALKSWAVPKGFPFRRGEKRLAVHVEDHPLAYAGFEGIIPEAEYGGGTVMLWDHGTWEPTDSKTSLRHALEGGKLSIILHGQKLTGEWTLVRMHDGDGKQWLLIRSGEDLRAPSARRDDQSVVSGRTMKQIAAAADAQWSSDPSSAKPAKRAQAPQRSKRRTTTPSRKSASALTARPRAALARRTEPALDQFVEPMKARLVDQPPAGDDWLYEIKFDGYRALAVKNGRRVELWSRNRNDLTERFPTIAAALAKLPLGHAVLDGEIVALDARGHSVFQLLQDRAASPVNILFYVFDLLRAGRRDLRSLPLETRRSELKEILRSAGGSLRFSESLRGKPAFLLEKACALGLEGLIAKRADSLYEAGRRSGAWMKIKCLNRQEFVIGGFTPPGGTRRYLGALLIGYYQGNALQYAGKVGTGFSARSCRELHDQLVPLEQPSPPFAPPGKAGGSDLPGLPPAERRIARWIQPRLVCEVQFTGWTRDGRLRHPVFLGLREDKRPRDVVRESPASTPEEK